MGNRAMNADGAQKASGGKRILVTGGAGFLGSHLCERLLAEGNRVIALDSFWTGASTNIERFAGDRSFELVRHDVTEPLAVEVDEIYNLACPGSPAHYRADPIHTVKSTLR